MIIQPPPRSIIERGFGPAISYFARRVSSAGHGLPGFPISWYRSPLHNQREGGDPASQHLVALAADIQFRERRSAQLAAARLIARGLTPVISPKGTAVHVQLFPASAQIVRRFAPDLIIR